MDACFERAGLNENAKLKLFRNAMMEFGVLAQFAILQGAYDYEVFKKCVRSFGAVQKVLRSHTASLVMLPPKRIFHNENQVDEKASYALKEGVDQITDQMSHISMQVKKNQSSGSRTNQH